MLIVLGFGLLMMVLLLAGGLFGVVQSRGQDGPVKWGFIDARGEWLIPPTFSEVRSFSEGLAAVQIGGLWGYVDLSGDLVIPATYRSAQSFQPSGLAWVEDASGKKGAIDRTGAVRIPATLARVTPFEQGVAAVGVEAGVRDVAGNLQPVFSFGLMDTSGAWLLPPLEGTRNPELLTAIGAFKDGLAPAQKAGKSWGYVDGSGVMKIPVQFEGAQSFSEGRAAVQQGRKWGYIEPSGSIVISPAFRHAHPFTEGIAAVCVSKCGFTLPDGAAPFAGNFESVGHFHSGVAAAKRDGKWGFVDTTGVWRVEPTFSSAHRDGYREGLAAVATGGGLFGGPRAWGFIDLSGTVKVPTQFADVQPFSEGAAAAAVREPARP